MTTLASESFRAIGTYVEVVAHDRLPEAVQIAREVIDAIDRTCSRFRPDSDLMRVNARPGSWVSVDSLLVATVADALRLAEDTDGLLDPLLGKAIVSLGYDRDFAGLLVRGPRYLARPTFGRWAEIELRSDAIRIPPGTALDLGSVAKAWASDLIAATIDDLLGVPALVSLGGDIAMSGEGEWPVGIQEQPDAATPDQVVWLSSGGLATSSTQVRRWIHNGVTRHHILDPRTGLPVPEVWRTVSATGPSCSAANAASTVALVLGADAPAWLASREVAARLVAADGSVVHVGQWPC